MVASMSRSANPYDNASCESFIKPLRREEIYVSRYENLEQLHANVEIFIDEYYNKQRLHSALGYRSPDEFERQAECPSETADHVHSIPILTFRPTAICSPQEMPRERSVYG
jgi:transposase InsO family protein